MKVQKTLYKILILGVVLNLFISCRKAATEIPFFLKCDSALISNSSLGIANSGIYGLYVTVGTDIRGTWQFPFKMPILKEGQQSMVVTPIVKNNNLSSQLIAYPLYQDRIIDIQMERGKTLDTVFSFDYTSDVKLIGGETMDLITNFTNSEKSSLARNGAGSMLLKADVNSADSTVSSFFARQLSFNIEKRTFLEFDYYMPEGVLAPALAYIDANGNARVMFGESYLNKNSGWTHVYYNYSYLINKIGKSGLFTPVFILTLSKGSSNASVYIDNLRILEK